jgi:hypothetical protein
MVLCVVNAKCRLAVANNQVEDVRLMPRIRISGLVVDCEIRSTFKAHLNVCSVCTDVGFNSNWQF